MLAPLDLAEVTEPAGVPGLWDDMDTPEDVARVRAGRGAAVTGDRDNEVPGLRDWMAAVVTELGLPEGFLYLLVYDYNSVFDRKNTPLMRLVDSADPQQLAGPSPCDGWSGFDVVQHLIDTQRDFLQKSGADMPDPTPRVEALGAFPLPVEIIGFDSVPDAGEFCMVVENERVAREKAQKRALRLKAELPRRGYTLMTPPEARTPIVTCVLANARAVLAEPMKAAKATTAPAIIMPRPFDGGGPPGAGGEAGGARWVRSTPRAERWPISAGSLRAPASG